MTARSNLSVSIDYISMVVNNLKAQEFIQFILQLPFEVFHSRNARMAHTQYTRLYECGNIQVFGDLPPSDENPNALGCYLLLKGQGCKEFFNYFCGAPAWEDELEPRITKHNYNSFFAHCKSQFSLKHHGFEYLSHRFTRIDPAIDDRNEKPFFTPEQIHNKCRKNEFISNSTEFKLVLSKFDTDDVCLTSYVGDGGSNISFRFYDKDKEQSEKKNIPIEDIGSLKRTEIQLRDDWADAFAYEMAKEPDALGEQVFALLKSNLRFVIPDPNESNRSRWKTCRFWERFLGAVKPLKMTIDKPDTSLIDTINWLKTGGALSAVRAFQFLKEHDALGGLSTIDELMQDVKFSNSLVNKLTAHLMELGRVDLIQELEKFRNAR